MLDNWTKEDFFIKVMNEGGFDGMASYCGRVSIIDDQEVEKAWDQYVQAWQVLEQCFIEWENNSNT